MAAVKGARSRGGARQGSARQKSSARGKVGAAALLEEVREFHAAGLCADFYDSFDVNSKDFMAKSEGTDEFRGARETESAPRWRG